MNDRLTRFLIGTGVAAAMLAVPAGAAAATTFVDAARPDNTGTCLSPAAACKTLGGVDGGIAKAGAGGTVNVESGTYSEAVTLGSGQSLAVNHFNGGLTAPVIDGGVSPAVTVSSAAGTISGFVLHGDPTAVQLNATATLSGNLFNADATSTGADVQLAAAAAGSTVQGNFFSDPDTSDDQIGIDVINGNDSTSVDQNAFSGFNRAIVIEGGTPSVSTNTIQGTHDSGIQTGAGIDVIKDAVASVSTNTISNPGSGSPIGIWVQEDTITPAGTGASISRNQVYNQPTGVRVDDATGGVTVVSDVIGNSTVTGVQINDLPPTGVGEGNTTVRNSTVAGAGGTDITATAALLTLDSSIVGAGGVSASNNGDCDIHFSRGPVKTSSHCGRFATTAQPRFKNSAANNFHIRSNSTMIDRGNRSAPPITAKDIDGNNRALDGDRDCAVRRDIGADEFVPAGPCIPPPPPHHGGPEALTKVFRHGLDRSFRIGRKKGGNYNLCVNGPPVKHHKACRSFRMRRVGPRHYVDVVRWGTHFGFKGPGKYTVAWYRRGDGKLLGDRRHFKVGVCPPANQSMKGVWKPSRLHITSHCSTVTGTVLTSPKVTRHDQDLTFHFTGPSLIELIPRDKGHTRRGSGTGPHNPRPGDRLRLTGVRVCDTYHGPRGHTEMHPVFKVEYIRNGHVAASYHSGPQYGGTPKVGLPILGPFPC